MNVNLLLKDMAEKEGFSSKPYHCPAGKLTIGFGTNLEDGITKQQASILAQYDLLDVKLELEDNLPFFHDLNEVRKGVLIRMGYNMGVPKLLKFKKTLIHLDTAVKNEKNGRLIDAREYYYKASIEMLDSKWHRDFVKWDMQDGKRTKVLRSEYLSQLMKQGEY